MTIANIPPIQEYDGNGIITDFEYFFQLTVDSSVFVIVDGFIVSNFNLNTPGIVQFDTAPAMGAKIVIYRRTTIYMPEDYRAMGYFAANKTELSVDRIYAILQEASGLNTELGNIGDAIVGGANIYSLRDQYKHTIVSERGTDAELLIWNPTGEIQPPAPEPDPSILFTAETVVGTTVSASAGTNLVAFFYKDWLESFEQPEGEASCIVQFAQPEKGSWVDTANPVLQTGQYWGRVREISIQGNFEAIDPENNPIVSGVPFDAVGSLSFWSVILKIPVADSPPFTYVSEFYIDICKDDGEGAPDEKWATKRITWTLDYTL